MSFYLKRSYAKTGSVGTSAMLDCGLKERRKEKIHVSIKNVVLQNQTSRPLLTLSCTADQENWLGELKGKQILPHEQA